MKRAILAALLMLFGCTEEPETQAVGGTNGEWVLTPSRVGPVEFGMTLSEALPHLQGDVDTATIADRCEYVTPRDAPAGLTLMVEQRRVVRADVRSGDVPTPEGARIGDEEGRILELYPSARRMPRKYTTGSYLVVLPLAPADTLRRYVFETDGQRVTELRAGLYPPVEYVERCG